MLTPKEGTIERIVLDRLEAAGDKGLTYFDFEDIGITEKQLDEIVQRLNFGVYEAEEDGNFRMDD